MPKIWPFKILIAPKKIQAKLLACYKKLEIVKLSCTGVNAVLSRDHNRKHLKSEK